MARDGKAGAPNAASKDEDVDQGSNHSHGGGLAGMAGWTESVDRLLDASPRFVTALRAAFIRFQTTGSSAAIPPSSLLPALQFFVQRFTEELGPKAGKLFLRQPMREDVDALAQQDPLLDIEQPLNAEEFGKIARKTLTRLAMDRGKRLGLFVLGGIVITHVAKGITKRLPFIGPAVGVLLDTLVPTAIVGPAVGVAGAVYM